MALKPLIYRFLLLTLIFVSPVSVMGQSAEDLFAEKYTRSQEILYDDPRQAVKLGKEAYDIAEDSEDMWRMSIANMGLALISYELGEYKVAYTNYSTSLRTLERADTTDYFHKAIVLSEMAFIQSEFNNHDGAIEHYEKAIESINLYLKKYPKHARENGYLNWLVDTHLYMAVEYQEKGAHQTAGKILFDLWAKAEDKNNVGAYAQVLNELGLVKSNNGEFAQAQEYFGLIISSDEIDEYNKSLAYHNLAVTYMQQGEYERSEGYFLIARDLKATLDDPVSEYVTLLDMGELYFKQGDSQKAIEQWEMALGVYTNIETDPELYSVYNWLQRAYMDIDIDKAKEYNQKYTQLNDFYVKNQSVQRELEAQNRQELSNWITEERNARVQAEQRQLFFKQFWPVFLGVGLLAIFSMIIGVRYYRTVRANKQLARQQMGFTAIHTRDEAA